MKITTINSIELSSICNLSCQWCPARLQKDYRPVGYMTGEIFRACIDHVRYYASQGTQQEINLFGVGEPTLHKDLVQFISYAHNNLPLRLKLHLNTNGLLMTEYMAAQLKDAGMNSIDVTGHDAKATAKTIRIFEKVGIPYRVSFDPILAPNNWAGQVDWFEPNYPNPYPCPWIGKGQVMIMSNGDVTRCCLDAFGKGIMGTVFDDLTKMDVTEFELCKDCHHTY